MVVFSFSLNAINSINTVSGNFFHSSKKISPPVSSNAQENFVFEEQENDSEDITCDAFLQLPFYNFSYNVHEARILDFKTPIFKKAVQPIFIAIQVFRI